jgi:hypothetical protein
MLALVAWAGSASAYEYGALIDAGSTGNRMYTFRWPARVYTPTELPQTAPTMPMQCGTSLKDGTYPLASIAATSEAMAAAYAPLFDHAAANLRDVACGFDGDLKTVPLFLTATAGMRVLPRANRTSRMEALRTAFGASPFFFPVDSVPASESNARIISGEEEGVFGWITTNILLPATAAAAAAASPSSGGALRNIQVGALGAMDMGGASTQLTFPPAKGGILAGLFSLDLGPSTHRPTYTHSFLFWGLNEALKQHERAVVASGAPDPCTPSRSSGDGGSDPDACTAAVDALIAVQRAAPCAYADADECSMLGTYQPPTDGVTFVAFSGFVYTYAFLFNRTDGALELDDLAEHAAAICVLNETELAAYNAQLVPAARSPKAAYWDEFCFNANYFRALLGDGYKMNATGAAAPTFVTVRADVDGQDFSCVARDRRLLSTLLSAVFSPRHHRALDATPAHATAACPPINSLPPSSARRYALGAAVFFANHLPWASAGGGSGGSSSGSAAGGALFRFDGAAQLWFGLWVVSLVVSAGAVALAATLFALRSRGRGARRSGRTFAFLGRGGSAAGDGEADYGGTRDAAERRDELPSSTFSLMPG